MPERTRFSTITADLAESSIHDLFPRLHADRDEITALKSQLDVILEHVRLPSDVPNDS